MLFARKSIHKARSKFLLVVSADADRDRLALRNRESPRRDYLELAAVLDADIYDFGSTTRSRSGRLLARWMGKGPAQAVGALLTLRDYDVVFSDSEHVGLFIGLACRLLPERPRHAVLAHHLTPAKKHIFVRAARNGVDRFIFHTGAQRQFAIDRLGVQAENTVVTPYQVDAAFWREVDVPRQAIVATAGLECRDYDTLIEAMDGLDLGLRIGAASNWSRKPNRLANRDLPSFVTVDAYDYQRLRELYSSAQLIVVPLINVDFQAGITTILEAMAIGRPVIVTTTSGQTDAVIGPLWSADMVEWPATGPAIQASTGIYVPPGDVMALRSAIRYLTDHESIAQTLGANGRRRVEQTFTIEHFVERLSVILSQGLGVASRESVLPVTSGSA